MHESTSHKQAKQPEIAKDLTQCKNLLLQFSLVRLVFYLLYTFFLLLADDVWFSGICSG